MRRSGILHANVVKIDKDKHIVIPNAGQRHQKRSRAQDGTVYDSFGSPTNTVSITALAPHGISIELIMNYQGMSRRKAKERVKRYDKQIKRENGLREMHEIRIRETFYTTSLPVLYIILGMFACIGRILAGDLSSNSSDAYHRKNYHPVQKKRGYH